ncbi:MAG: hypothetical protein EXS16_18790 [Gemmataceae bacterium]|nr:hypothetical protein [Gemmataceae bacterium]
MNQAASFFAVIARRRYRYDWQIKIDQRQFNEPPRKCIERCRDAFLKDSVPAKFDQFVSAFLPIAIQGRVNGTQVAIRISESRDLEDIEDGIGIWLIDA